MLDTVIFDLDGTLANINQRRIHLTSTPPNWDLFNSNMSSDVPNAEIVKLYKTLWNSHRYDLIIVSGRSDEYRKFTEQWLSWNDIPFNTLMMRKKEDFRSDYIIKEEILRQIQSLGKQIAFVVDDRQQVVDMWRKNGIVCLQCDYGNF